MDRADFRKLVPPKPLESYYTDEGELDRYGKPLPAGSLRYNGNWGLFGYEGALADKAIACDSVAGIRWCIDHGIIAPETQTLYNTPLRRLAEERGAKLIAHHLAELGWPA